MTPNPVPETPAEREREARKCVVELMNFAPSGSWSDAEIEQAADAYRESVRRAYADEMVAGVMKLEGGYGYHAIDRTQVLNLIRASAQPETDR